MSKKAQVDEYNIFQCATCEGAPEFSDVEELKRHLADVHGVTDMLGKRHGVMFLDGAEFYRNIYEWEIGGVKISQVVQGRRADDDIMRFMGDE